MPLAFEQKEDLRLRVVDLEQKLEESEEERIKLEKTCNMLVRAFREEEKMHYKALNNKYEKFLEDCKVRRRRNDIILKSLCRVEDRTKALYARTERLKLLKDRYISYLKPNDSRYNRIAFPEQKVVHSRLETPGFDKPVSKTVSWKSPHVAELLNYNSKESEEYREIVTLRHNTRPNESFDYALSAPSRSRPHESLAEKYNHLYLENNDIKTYGGRCQRENILDRNLFQVLENRAKLNLLDSNLKNTQKDSTSYTTFKKDDHKESPRPSVQEVENLRRLNSCDDSLCQNSMESHIPVKEKNETNLMSRLNEMENYTFLKQLAPEKIISFHSDTCIQKQKASDEKIKYKDEELVENLSKKFSDDSELEPTNLEKKSEDIIVNYQSPKNKENINPLQKELKNNISNKVNEMDLDDLQNLAVLKEKGFIKHQECIENLKTALTKEEEYKRNKNAEKICVQNDQSLQKIIEKDEIEISKKISMGSSDGSIVKHAEDSEVQRNSSNTEAEENFKVKTSNINEKEEVEDENFPFPKGMDGIDYENETYPESYYEQPVHHRNYSDIVTNVILEEDENEQENDQPEEVTKPPDKCLTENNADKTNLQELAFNKIDSCHSSSSPSISEASKSQKSDLHDDSHSNGQFGGKITKTRFQSEKNDGLIKNSQKTSDEFQINENAVETFESNKEKPKGLIQSNLVHLLESDSESFQIEHGDLVSGNDDSDFDFSFH